MKEIFHDHMTQELSIEARRDRARDLLAYRGFMSLSELVAELDVSESTVRRDLESLEVQGLVRRTHGGAVYVKEAAYAFAEHQTTCAAEKRAIGRAAAELIGDGQTVFIDGGTTCLEVARHLVGRRLSVVTNSLPIASLLSAEMATEVTLLGGYVYPRTGVALGSMTQQQVRGVHGSMLVLGCAGLAPEAAYNPNQMMVDVERDMIAAADKVVLVIDHTKFNQRAVARLCEPADIDMIITDDRLPEADRQWLGEHWPAELIIAPMDEER